ncbi:MAG: hypothetical protein JWP13_444 [Candidatus Saccharibacteria bacterium]|nr:hypothetical protein [Candidatus Saccharibacteria bacterium]
MNILRRERPIANREHLEAYLDIEGGFVPAKIITPNEVFGWDPDTGEEVYEADPTEERGHYARSSDENEGTSIVFIPRGWKNGKPEPNSYNMSPDYLRPGEQLTIDGLKIVVLSRHDVPVPVPEPASEPQAADLLGA